METPLVTVICLCHNHEKFVKEAIESVLNQTHPHIQLIVVDDASTDQSSSVISKLLESHPDVPFLALQKNLGNCKAFNKGWELCEGDFVIDLAADDVLMPERVETGLQALASHDEEYGVHFSDAELIDESGKRMGYHSDRFPHNSIPEGDIYKDLIGRYFVCSPTMMFRSSVLKRMGGYDEALAYEDFDFWIRSSRQFKYCYTPEPLVKRRILRDSLARVQYRYGSQQMISTYKVCNKIFKLNQNDEERRVLSKRILYEMKKAARYGNGSLALKYFKLLLRNNGLLPVVPPGDHA